MLLYRTRDTDTLGSLAQYWYQSLPWWMGAQKLQEANNLKGEWNLAGKVLEIPEFTAEEIRRMFR